MQRKERREQQKAGRKQQKKDNKKTNQDVVMPKTEYETFLDKIKDAIANVEHSEQSAEYIKKIIQRSWNTVSSQEDAILISIDVLLRGKNQGRSLPAILGTSIEHIINSSRILLKEIRNIPLMLMSFLEKLDSKNIYVQLLNRDIHTHLLRSIVILSDQFNAFEEIFYHQFFSQAMLLNDKIEPLYREINAYLQVSVAKIYLKHWQLLHADIANEIYIHNLLKSATCLSLTSLVVTGNKDLKPIEFFKNTIVAVEQFIKVSSSPALVCNIILYMVSTGIYLSRHVYTPFCPQLMSHDDILAHLQKNATKIINKNNLISMTDKDDKASSYYDNMLQANYQLVCALINIMKRSLLRSKFAWEKIKYDSPLLAIDNTINQNLFNNDYHLRFSKANLLAVVEYSVDEYKKIEFYKYKYFIEQGMPFFKNKSAYEIYYGGVYQYTGLLHYYLLNYHLLVSDLLKLYVCIYKKFEYSNHLNVMAELIVTDKNLQEYIFNEDIYDIIISPTWKSYESLTNDILPIINDYLFAYIYYSEAHKINYGNEENVSNYLSLPEVSKLKSMVTSQVTVFTKTNLAVMQIKEEREAKLSTYFKEKLEEDVNKSKIIENVKAHKARQVFSAKQTISIVEERDPGSGSSSSKDALHVLPLSRDEALLEEANNDLYQHRVFVAIEKLDLLLNKKQCQDILITVKANLSMASCHQALAKILTRKVANVHATKSNQYLRTALEIIELELFQNNYINNSLKEELSTLRYFIMLELGIDDGEDEKIIIESVCHSRKQYKQNQATIKYSNQINKKWDAFQHKTTAPILTRKVDLKQIIKQDEVLTFLLALQSHRVNIDIYGGAIRAFVLGYPQMRDYDISVDVSLAEIEIIIKQLKLDYNLRGNDYPILNVKFADCELDISSANDTNTRYFSCDATINAYRYSFKNNQLEYLAESEEHRKLKVLDMFSNQNKQERFQKDPSLYARYLCLAAKPELHGFVFATDIVELFKLYQPALSKFDNKMKAKCYGVFSRTCVNGRAVKMVDLLLQYHVLRNRSAYASALMRDVAQQMDDLYYTGNIPSLSILTAAILWESFYNGVMSLSEKNTDNIASLMNHVLFESEIGMTLPRNETEKTIGDKIKNIWRLCLMMLDPNIGLDLDEDAYMDFNKALTLLRSIQKTYIQYSPDAQYRKVR